jgi:hypothetical protein
VSRSGVRRVTWRALRARRRELAALGGWSLVESLPALLAGYLVARAVDEGFLAGRLVNGLAWLGVLGVAVLVGAAATGRTYRSLGAVVEPFRDEVAAQVVRGALRDATRADGRPDSAAVTRLTHQMEIVRDTFAGLLMVTRGFPSPLERPCSACSPWRRWWRRSRSRRWSPVWSCFSPRCRRWSRTSAPTSGPVNSSASRRRSRWPVTATCWPAAPRHA